MQNPFMFFQHNHRSSSSKKGKNAQNTFKIQTSSNVTALNDELQVAFKHVSACAKKDLVLHTQTLTRLRNMSLVKVCAMQRL